MQNNKRYNNKLLKYNIMHYNAMQCNVSRYNGSICIQTLDCSPSKNQKILADSSNLVCLDFTCMMQN